MFSEFKKSCNFVVFMKIVINLLVIIRGLVMTLISCILSIIFSPSFVSKTFLVCTCFWLWVVNRGDEGNKNFESWLSLKEEMLFQDRAYIQQVKKIIIFGFVNFFVILSKFPTCELLSFYKFYILARSPSLLNSWSVWHEGWISIV